MPQRPIRTYALCLLGLLVIAGCGGGTDRPRLSKIDVMVTYKGTPLEQGAIRFEPTDGRPAVGSIVDGHVSEMTTFDGGDGVAIGKHRVTIEAFAPTDNPMADIPKPLIPMKYASTQTSGLTADVQSSGPNKFTFELTE